MTKYTITEGKQNFKPIDNPFPRRAKEFQVIARLTESCYYSFEDWDQDQDWNDWNKLKGLSWFFSDNAYDSALIGWRPGEAKNTFQISPYTRNGKESHQALSRDKAIVVKADETFKVTVKIYRKVVHYDIETADGDHHYVTHNLKRKKPRWYREMGTWIGGANNDAEGKPYGGKATKDMTLYAKLRIIK